MTRDELEQAKKDGTVLRYREGGNRANFGHSYAVRVQATGLSRVASNDWGRRYTAAYADGVLVLFVDRAPKIIQGTWEHVEDNEAVVRSFEIVGTWDEYMEQNRQLEAVEQERQREREAAAARAREFSERWERIMPDAAITVSASSGTAMVPLDILDRMLDAVEGR